MYHVALRNSVRETHVRLFLAFRCFFRVLLGRPLPAGLALEDGSAAAGTGKSLAAPRGAKGGGAAEIEARKAGAVTLLAVLQREGRIVDFLEEEIDGNDDAQVGAAVRDIHKGCRRALREHLGLEHVMTQQEGASVRVPEGFDAAAIRLTGAVSGEPPFTGRLRHPGWRAAKVELPRTANGIIAPAEVEVGA